MPYPVIFGASGQFLDSVLGLCLFIAVMRFLFQCIDADTDIPLVRFVAVVTEGPIRLLRRVTPAMFGVSGRDLAAALFAYLVAVAKLTVLLTVADHDFNWGGALLLSLADALDTLAWVFVFAVLGSAIASWIFPRSWHPLIRIAHHASSPVLMPIREMLPVIAGIDFSPLVGLLALRLAQQWLIAPLANLGLQLL